MGTLMNDLDKRLKIMSSIPTSNLPNSSFFMGGSTNKGTKGRDFGGAKKIRKAITMTNEQ